MVEATASLPPRYRCLPTRISGYEEPEWSENWLPPVSGTLGYQRASVNPGVPDWNALAAGIRDWSAFVESIRQSLATGIGTVTGDPHRIPGTSRIPESSEYILVYPTMMGLESHDFIYTAPDSEWTAVEIKGCSSGRSSEWHSQATATADRLLSGAHQWGASQALLHTGIFPDEEAVYFRTFKMGEIVGTDSRLATDDHLHEVLGRAVGSAPRRWNPRQEQFTLSLSDRLQNLRYSEDAADVAIANRIEFLRTPEDGDDDVSLSGSAAIGFLELLDRIGHPRRIEPSLTTTGGWLCSTWRFGEGRPVLVIWFKNRHNTMLTVLSRGSDVPADIGQDLRSQNAAALVELLNEHRIFLGWARE